MSDAVRQYPQVIRRPVGTSASEWGAFVVCDDGSTWTFLVEGSDGWVEGVPIPGTLRAWQLEQQEEKRRRDAEAG